MHRTYENDDIVILWDSEKCIHAKECREGSPETFDPARRPWIQLGLAENARVWKAIERCPSGALSVFYRHETDVVMEPDKCRSIASEAKKTVGMCEYHETEAGLEIYRTVVDADREDMGIAKRLVFKVLEAAERQNITVSATCSYAREVMGR